MKRSPLVRRTPLRRKRRETSQAIDDFKNEFQTCWKCGATPVDLHHISRLRRWDVRENFCCLCRKCHVEYHDDAKTRFKLPQVLYLKWKHDRAWFDLDAVLELLVKETVEIGRV